MATMKNYLYRVVSLLAVFTALVGVGSIGSVVGGFSTTAYARAKFDATTVDQNSLPFAIMDSDSGISSVVSNINNEIQVQLSVRSGEVSDGWRFLYYDGNSKKVSIDRKNFLEYRLSTRKKIMDIALSNLTEERSGGVSARDRARLYKFVEDQDQNVARVLQAVNRDVTADINEARNYLKFIQAPLNTFLGVLIILISMSVAISISMDVFCMITPSIMYYVTEKYTKVPWFMSARAYYAYKESISGKEYSDYMMKYIMKSIPALVFTGACLSYIMVGNTIALAMFFANLFNR